MLDVITAWLASMIDNAPYLVGAAIAMFAMWRELRECHQGNNEIANRLLDHLIDQRTKLP